MAQAQTNTQNQSTNQDQSTTQNLSPSLTQSPPTNQSPTLSNQTNANTPPAANGQPVSPNQLETNIPATPRPKTLGDEVPRGETVAQRPRPDYAPAGIRVGSFLVFPNITEQENFESNILGTRFNPISDFITSTQPSLDVRSDWNNHALNFHADDSWNVYAQHSSQNYNDYSFSSDGRLDIDRDARAFGGIGYSVRHEPVYTPNNPGVINPLFTTIVPEQYSDLAAKGALEKSFNRLSFRFDATYDQFNFADAMTVAGLNIPMHLENYNQELLSLKTSYELAEQRQVYLLTSYDWRNHDFAADLSGVNRTSHGFVIAGGFHYDLTGITFLDLYAGYLQQDYMAPLPSVTGPTGGAKLTWNVTRLTTVTGSIDRGLQETILPGASSYFDTTAQLGVDHELLRNLILTGTTGWEQDAFQGGSRTDYYYSAGASAKYLINRHFSVSVGYTFQDRISNSGINNFTNNIVFVNFSAHL